ncbi:hypothetical protein SAMN04489841_3546 [Natrinema salaciae]|uniref:Uncharacterized protein n=1 Tax=Natrinema salaciae TaxID=1186196 RepID=A0A1H9MYF3_9EURY|nr:hypothetical protein SAMN04489841_3546 [Natrinema salaciae]
MCPLSALEGRFKKVQNFIYWAAGAGRRTPVVGREPARLPARVRPAARPIGSLVPGTVPDRKPTRLLAITVQHGPRGISPRRFHRLPRPSCSNPRRLPPRATGRVAARTGVGELGTSVRRRRDPHPDGVHDCTTIVRNGRAGYYRYPSRSVVSDRSVHRRRAVDDAEHTQSNVSFVAAVPTGRVLPLGVASRPALAATGPRERTAVRNRDRRHPRSTKEERREPRGHVPSESESEPSRKPRVANRAPTPPIAPNRSG